MTGVAAEIAQGVTVLAAQAPHLLTRLLLLGAAASVVVPALAVLLSAAAPWSRGISARLRFRVLASAFALVLAAPLVFFSPRVFFPTVALPWMAQPAHLSQAAVALPAAGAGWQIPEFGALAIAAVWLLVSAVLLLRLLLGLVRLHGLRREAVLLPEPLLQSMQARLEAGASPCPVALSHAVRVPCLTGLLRPMVLLPAQLPEQLSESRLAAILEHEFAHLRRGDHWSNLAQKLACAVFPLHPGLHLLDVWMSREREHACDEWVLLQAHPAAEYATSLVDVAAGAMETAALSVPFGAIRSRSELARRIDRIVRPLPQLSRRVATVLAVCLTAGSTAMVGMAVHLLPPIRFAPMPGAASVSGARQMAALRLDTAESMTASNAAGNTAGKTAGRAAVQQQTAAATPKLRRIAARVQPSLAERDALTRRIPHTGDWAEMVAWHEPASGVGTGRADAAHRRAEHPLLAATDRAQSVYLVMTSISVTEAGQGIWTASRTVAVMAESLESGADVASARAERAASQPDAMTNVASVRSGQVKSGLVYSEQEKSGRAKTTQAGPSVVYSIVTTTLRVPAGAELRFAPEWLAREL